MPASSRMRPRRSFVVVLPDEQHARLALAVRSDLVSHQMQLTMIVLLAVVHKGFRVAFGTVIDVFQCVFCHSQSLLTELLTHFPILIIS